MHYNHYNHNKCIKDIKTYDDILKLKEAYVEQRFEM